MNLRLLLPLSLLVVAGCIDKPGANGAGVRQGTGATWSFQDLKPDSAPTVASELSLGGTRLPVKLTSKKDKGTFELDMIAHDVILDREVYDVQTEQFSLSSMGSETVEPPIPIAKSPMRVGDKWTWEGTVTSGTAHHTTATISTRADKLYLGDKQFEAVVVEVNLSMESGGPAPAERRLTFWFVPGQGVVKREFGSGSIRQPVSKA